MSNHFVQPLYDAALDIVGDIHGEIDALKSLMKVLGYDENGQHLAQRKLIFVGDLCDRGLNSVAVIQLVKRLIENGNAQCVLGNHELNLLIESKREGNGWFFGSPHEDDEKPFNSNAISAAEKDWIIQFLNTLPLALESEKLRIVHACWDQASIDALQQCHSSSIKAVYDQFVQRAEQQIQSSGIAHHAQQEELCYQAELKNPHAQVPLLENLAQKDILEQMHNPIKVLTSGAEVIVEHPFFAGGKWRMVGRLPWWQSYQAEIPVVMGHYWRNFNSTEQKSGLFKHIDAVQWFGLKGNVFCVDYSVGKRYLDRHHQRDFSHQLIALRFPERVLMLEDGRQLQTEPS